MDKSPPPLRGWALVIAALAINLGVFAEVLDLSIINVAIPAIAGSLGSSQSEATWAITSYAVAAAVVQPITGWLTARYGEVRVFMVSSLLFTAASTLCGLAPSLELLVLFRLLQGAVGGPLIPLSQALMLKTFPEHRRALAQALWGMTALAGPIFGPVLGGWLTDQYSWRWAFFINIPVGLFTVGVLWFLLRHRDTPTVRGPVDYIGILLLALGVGSLQFMFDHGHQEDWFDSTMIIALAVIGIMALTFFAVWERYESNPIVSFSLFRRRTYSIPVMAVALCYGAAYGIIVIFPLWLQQVAGYTATQAGLASASFGVSAVASAVVLGIVGNRLPLRTAASCGFVMFAIGSVWLALLPANATFWQFFAARFLHGAATPLFFFAVSEIMYTGVPPSMLAAASSLSSFVRTMFLSLSTALTVTAWDQRSSVHHVLLAESVNPLRTTALAQTTQQALGVTPTPDQSGQALGLIEGLAQLQARTLALDDLCWFSVVVFLLMIPLIWIPKPPFGGGGGGGVH